MSQEQTKTIYRIITIRTFIADRYLQFKSKATKKVREYPFFWRTRTIESECWRFIPRESTAYVLGYCLNEQSCPTEIPYGWEGRLLHCFYGHEDYSIGGVVPFTRKYPNIENYFEELRNKREAYLKEEREKNSAVGEITELA